MGAAGCRTMHNTRIHQSRVIKAATMASPPASDKARLPTPGRCPRGCPAAAPPCCRPAGSPAHRCTAWLLVNTDGPSAGCRERSELTAGCSAVKWTRAAQAGRQALLPTVPTAAPANATQLDALVGLPAGMAAAREQVPTARWAAVKGGSALGVPPFARRGPMALIKRLLTGRGATGCCRPPCARVGKREGSGSAVGCFAPLQQCRCQGSSTASRGIGRDAKRWQRASAKAAPGRSGAVGKRTQRSEPMISCREARHSAESPMLSRSC